MVLGNIVIWGLILTFMFWLVMDWRTRRHHHEMTSSPSAVYATPSARGHARAPNLDRQLSVAHEPPDSGHHLSGSRVLLAGLGSDHARMGVPVEQPERDLIQRCLDRRDLSQNVNAVAVLLDHPLDAAHLALNTSQPRLELILGGCVAARRRRGLCAHTSTLARHPRGVC
jgi:hypothetical protein